MPGLKPDLIDYLEKKREEELAERKEKSQKQSEEASKEKSNNTSIGWEAPQYMEVTANHYRGEGRERERRENSCNGLFRFTFKKYIEKQFSSMRGKTDTYAHESMILLKVTQTPTTTSGSAATTTVTMTTSDSTVTTSAGRQIST